MPGSEFHRLWGADSSPSFPDDGAPLPQPTYFPPVGGFRFGMFTIPPEGGPAPMIDDLDAAMQEIEEKLPGMLSHMEPDSPGMHTQAMKATTSGRCWFELRQELEETVDLR